MARIALVVLAMLAATPALGARPKPAPPAATPEAPAPLAPSVRNGVELWRAGDYAGAVMMWQPFANGGDADAMFNIGQAYKLGRGGLPKDAVQARDWYRKAAAKGHLPAQANLGILLFQAGEKPEAIRWLKAAADKNEMRAQYVLGVAHWNGDGVPRSMALAYGYLSRASAQGLAEATTALGNLGGQLSPIDRANGMAVASSLAGGNGVPPEFAPGAPKQALASNDSYNRDQVIKPLPAPVAVAVAPPVTPPVTVIKPPVVQSTLAPSTLPPPAVKPPPPPVVAAVTPKPVTVPPVATPPAKIAIVSVAPATSPTPMPPPKPAPVVVAEARPVAPAVTSVAIPASTPPVATEKPPEAAPVAVKPAAKPPTKPAEPPLQTADATPKPAAKTPPKPTGWRIQLGAFSKRAQAEAAWKDVQEKQKKAVAGVKPIYEANGSITKLQLGPYASEKSARDTCAKIAFSGSACFVTTG